MKIENITVKLNNAKDFEEEKRQLKNINAFFKNRGIKNEYIIVNDYTVLLVNLTGKNGSQKVLNTIINIEYVNK